MKRFLRFLSISVAILVIAGLALTIRTPSRRAAWLAEYDSTRHYLATADANFDWVVRKKGIDLVTLDNEFSSKQAVKNAELMIKEKVDLVFEHQGDERVSPVVASKLRDAGIPMVAIHIPHPGATYFGPDNYNAGLIGGRYLGRWANAWARR